MDQDKLQKIFDTHGDGKSIKMGDITLTLAGIQDPTVGRAVAQGKARAYVPTRYTVKNRNMRRRSTRQRRKKHH